MQPRIVYTDGPIDLRKPRDGKKYMHMFPNFGPFAGKTDEGTSKKFRFLFRIHAYPSYNKFDFFNSELIYMHRESHGLPLTPPG